jgi:hypothetical protein
MPDPPSDTAPASIFPLPLTPFELYYLLDDRREYPTTFPVEARFSGELDPARFRAALEATVARHPLLRATVEDRRGTLQWVEAGGRPHVDWADESATIRHADGEFIDLRSAPGLRTWVRAGAGSARVLFQFHHACCDGLAALDFLKDVLAAYKAAAAEGPSTQVGREIDPRLLLARGEFVPPGTEKPTFGVALRDAWYTLNVWCWILLQKPRALEAAKQTAAGSDSAPLLAYSVATLSREQSRALRAAAASLGATSNDLLLRDFLRVLRMWNERHAGSGQGRFRINVPVSVRTREEAAMPAANRIGYGFVTDDGRAPRDPASLLAVVRAETGRIKDWKLALYFLGGLSLAAKSRALVRFGLRRRVSLATAVLSNVGRFIPERGLKRDERWTCGGLVLESVGGVPPLRPLTRAAMIVIDYAGCTSFCLRCDPHHFDAAATEQLLSAFVEEVRETVRRGN